MKRPIVSSRFKPLHKTPTLLLWISLWRTSLWGPTFPRRRITPLVTPPKELTWSLLRKQRKRALKPNNRKIKKCSSKFTWKSYRRSRIWSIRSRIWAKCFSFPNWSLLGDWFNLEAAGGLISWLAPFSGRSYFFTTWPKLWLNSREDSQRDYRRTRCWSTWWLPCPIKHSSSFRLCTTSSNKALSMSTSQLHSW